MIRFPWKRLYGRQAFHYPYDGGTKATAAKLAGLRDEFRRESEHWKGDAADQLWDNAWTLEALRRQLINGAETADYAANWIIAAQTTLDNYRGRRSRANHPAGKAR